jgi:hypothetical protein
MADSVHYLSNIFSLEKNRVSLDGLRTTDRRQGEQPGERLFQGASIDSSWQEGNSNSRILK